jgi:energy-coupling factor transporter transmembrane protein EcfT
MELTFILYIFAAFIVIPGTFFVLSLFRKFLAGGIAFIGMLVLFVLFGIQFFTSDGKTVQQTKPTKWPLTINYCPDYLSLLKVSNSYVCVDTVGVATGNTPLQKFNPSSPVTGNNTPSDSQTFNLHLNERDDTARREKIINDCKAKGLTFEGIYDGLKTYENVIPRI